MQRVLTKAAILALVVGLPLGPVAGAGEHRGADEDRLRTVQPPAQPPRGRIPTHTPEWTNPRQGDPGRAAGDDNNTEPKAPEAERRIPQRLRHKDRL